MQLPAKKSRLPLSKRQIPTVLGLGILIVSLVAGLFMFSGGTGVFAPRATPQTTPKNVQVTNLTDKSFTVSFYTDEATSGFVKYGPSDGSLKSQASDDRDQLSGSVGEFQLHHITVRGLTPSTAYGYTLGTGSVPRFDNNGAPFSITTFPALSGSPPINKTIYGTVATPAGAPAEGSIVFVLGEGMAELSSLVKSSGSWAIALSNARMSDGSDYAQLSDETSLNVIIQGVEPGKSSIFSTTIAEAQPVPEVVLGDTPAARPVVVEPVEEETATDSSAQSGGLNDLLGELADEAVSGLDESNQQAASVLDLAEVAEGEQPTVTAEPVITGTAAPGVTVSIEVHSDAQISQTLVADQNGKFSLNIAALGAALDPGEHTVTYSYTDPNTGQLVTRTQTFMVADSTQLAQAGTPFGSGDPFPVEATPTPTPAPTIEATRSAVVATDSGTFNSGSVQNTIALIIGGIFFLFAGTWSWWLAQEARKA